MNRTLFILALLAVIGTFITGCEEKGKSAMQLKMEEAAKMNESYKKEAEAKKLEKKKWIDEDEKVVLPPVFKAISEKNGVEVKNLINGGLNVNTADDKNKTILMAAAGEGLNDVVDLLLDKGADVKAKKVDGDTALMTAARNGFKEIADKLIEKGADPLAKDNFGRTVLMMAARGGNLELVKDLVEKGADVNDVDKYNRTALVAALMDKKIDVANYLVDKGTDVKISCKSGKTPLFYAIETGNFPMVKKIVDKGAPIIVEDIEKYQEIMPNGELSKEKERKIPTTAYDKDRKNILMYASEIGNLDMVKLFVSKGAKIEEKDGKNLRSPLLFIASAKQGTAEQEKAFRDTAAYLIELGKEEITIKKPKIAKEQIEQKEKKKAWFERNKDAGYDMIKVKKIELEDYDYDGWTAITLAAQNGHFELVKLLVESGVMVNRKERAYGRTALIYSRVGKYKDIEDYLKAHGAKEGLKFDAEEDAKKAVEEKASEK